MFQDGKLMVSRQVFQRLMIIVGSLGTRAVVAVDAFETIELGIPIYQLTTKEEAFTTRPYLESL